jgi:hypothetical protein
MRRGRMLRIAAFVLIFGAIFIAGFGWAVLQLWNWLMPPIFGLPLLTFWQAVGLLALGWIFFGSWRGFGRYSGRWHHGMRERWEQMTPEEREKFRERMAHRCGRGSTPDAPAS